MARQTFPFMRQDGLILTFHFNLYKIFPHFDRLKSALLTDVEKRLKIKGKSPATHSLHKGLRH
jgi:hypothetical protein